MPSAMPEAALFLTMDESGLFRTKFIGVSCKRY
jgi:hypothetical protein